MDFDFTLRQKEIVGRVSSFMDEHVYPAVPVYEAQEHEGERLALTPEDLGLRITYLASAVTGTSVPDNYCDLAVPFA